MLRLADEIASLNEQQLNQGSRRVAELFRQVHNTIQATLLFTLLAGIGLAVFSISSILQVEREATARYLETAQARQELKKLSAQLVHAQENERRAISRELHDEVGQAMSALLVGLSGLLVAVPEGARAALAPRVNALREIAENSVRAARNLALLLRPSMLDDLGLMPALHWQAREVARDTGLRVDVASDEVFDNLPDEHKTCIYRVVQEALHNVTRHAQAEVVRINIKQEARAIFLTIQDDGRGFNAQERGLGLLGMNERVANLGGSFTVESHLGRGTLMSVCLPLPQGVET